MTVTLLDGLGEPIANASDVAVKFSYLGADLGAASASLQNGGDGAYGLPGQVMSIQGLWQAEVLVQRPDAFDAQSAFRFALGGVGASAQAVAPKRETGLLLLGVELVLLGVLYLGVAGAIGAWRTRWGRGIGLPGVASVGAGALFLAAPLWLPPTTNPAGTGVNPFAPTSQSLAVGKTIYAEKCAVCHGASGRGDGPSAKDLNPPPLDLTIHVPLHPE